MRIPVLLNMRVHGLLDVPRMRTAGDSMLCCKCSSIVTFSLIGVLSLLLPTCTHQHTNLCKDAPSGDAASSDDCLMRLPK